MNLAQIIDMMEGAGATQDVVVGFVKKFTAHEAAAAAVAAEARRTKETERKRRYRSTALVSHHVPRDTTGHHGTARDATGQTGTPRDKRQPTVIPDNFGPEDLPLPPAPSEAPLSLGSKKDSIEKNKTPEGESGAPKKASNRPTRLPDDWAPDAAGIAFAKTCLPIKQIPHELDKFRDHWKGAAGKGSTSPDWNAKWRTWCKRAAEYAEQRRGRGAPASEPREYANPLTQETHDVIRGIRDRVLNRQSEQGDEAGSGDAVRTTDRQVSHAEDPRPAGVHSRNDTGFQQISGLHLRASNR